MPPVANTRTPAIAAQIIVAATVVAPVRPDATQTAISRRLTLATPSARHISSSSSSVSPALTRPRTIAIVAGTAPSARMTASARRANARLSG